MRRPTAGGRANFRRTNPPPLPVTYRLQHPPDSLFISTPAMRHSSSSFLTRWYGPGLMRLVGLLGLLALWALSTTA